MSIKTVNEDLVAITVTMTSEEWHQFLGELYDMNIMTSESIGKISEEFRLSILREL